MNKPRNKPRGNYIDVLLSLPWQINLVFAALAFSMKWLLDIPFQNPSVRMAVVMFVMSSFPLCVSFIIIAGLSFFKNRSKPPPDLSKVRSRRFAKAVSQEGNIASLPHEVVHGWTKDGNNSGYSIFQNNAGEVNPKPPTSWSIELLQQIEWKLFEDLSAAFYQEKGIRAELTKLGADGGIDIKLYQDDSGKPTSLVQCKAWNSKQVGVKEIREFLGVLSHEKIAKGFYMASGVYSIDAKEFAKLNGITLIDGVMLLTMIRRMPVDAQQRLLNLSTAGDYTTPSCPSCGIKMLKKMGKRGEFWGCSNYPKCLQKLYIKKQS
jgi:restriction system protein